MLASKMRSGWCTNACASHDRIHMSRCSSGSSAGTRAPGLTENGYASTSVKAAYRTAARHFPGTGNVGSIRLGLAPGVRYRPRPHQIHHGGRREHPDEEERDEGEVLAHVLHGLVA